MTLSNGAAAVADTLLTLAGVREELEQLLSVGRHRLEARRGVLPLGHGALRRAVADAMLVAVHPWDIDGAARAGMRTAWLDRRGTAYPAYFTAPELTATSLTQLADLIG